MLAADALSHYAPLKAPEIPLDITINHVYITPNRKTEFQSHIQDDLLLCSLAKTIIAGWPDDINDVPCALCLTFSYILPSEREKILQAIHEGHIRISKCQNRARHCVYWPGINSGIKHLIESCPTCQQEPQQLLHPTLALESQWQLLGADYFHIDGSEYLDAHCQKNPCISMQCRQDHLSPDGTLCRTWHPRGTPYWKKSPVCQCTLHQVCNRLEVLL